MKNFSIPILYLMIQGYHVAIGFFASIFLPKSEYGFFKLLETYTGLATIIISFGMATLLIRFSSKSDWEGVGNEYIETIFLNFIIFLVLTLSGIILISTGIVENIDYITMHLILALSFLTAQIKNGVAIIVGKKSPELVFSKIYYPICFLMALSYFAYQNKIALIWIELKLISEILILLLIANIIFTRSKLLNIKLINAKKIFYKLKEGVQVNISLFTRLACDSLPIFILSQFPNGKMYSAEWGIAALAVFFLNTAVGLYFQKCMPDIFRATKIFQKFDYNNLMKNAIRVGLIGLIISVAVHLIQHKYISWVDFDTTNIFVCLILVAFIKMPTGTFGVYCTVNQKYIAQIKLNVLEILITGFVFYLTNEYAGNISAMMISVVLASLCNSLFSLNALQRHSN